MDNSERLRSTARDRTPAPSGSGLDWQHFGVHRYAIDGDLLFIVYQGEITLDDVQTIIDLFAELQARHGHVLHINEVHGNISLGAEVRRRFAEEVRRRGIVLMTASVGASAILRALAVMICNAIRMLGGHPPTISFFDTRLEARLWIDSQRKKLLARRATL